MRTTAVAALLLVVTSTGCGRTVRSPASQESTPAADAITAEIRLGPQRGPVNRRILGNNVQWVDRGDGLLTADGAQFDPQMLDLVEPLGTTVLRYPGGSLADTFDWRSGDGLIRSRGTSERFLTRQRQTVLFGTAEFLALCKRLNAEPMITVNVAAGAPRDAADWVRSVNRSRDGGIVAGPVRYWEVGNEPYLRDEIRPEAAVAPETFAVRANAFIRAMRDVDNSIVIGIPLRSDRVGTLPAVAFPGFAETVMRGINERFDFVALHNAYLPFVSDRGARYAPEDLFRAAMAAYQVVEEDLGRTRQVLDRFHPGQMIPFALTEYNSFYTLGGSLDNHIASLGGALYVADLLRVLASRDDILAANFWSLTGNWVFGAVSNQRQLRPAYHVLRAYSEILRGQRLDLEVRGPTFDAPAIGAVPATRAVPVIAALATTYVGHTSLLIINKSADTPAVITLQGRSGRVISARELTDARIFDPSHEAGGLHWRDMEIKNETPLRLPVNSHSLLWIEFDAP